MITKWQFFWAMLMVFNLLVYIVNHSIVTFVLASFCLGMLGLYVIKDEK